MNASDMKAGDMSGGCQCGAVRYRITAGLSSVGVCHCRMCQKAFGNFGAILAAVPDGALSWTRGPPAEFRSSAIVARGFCRKCGTPLYMKEDGQADYEIAVCTLDNPSAIRPHHQVGLESKLPWFDTIATLPGHTTAEDRSADDLKRLASHQHPDHDTEHWET